MLEPKGVERAQRARNNEEIWHSECSVPRLVSIFHSQTMPWQPSEAYGIESSAKRAAAQCNALLPETR